MFDDLALPNLVKRQLSGTTDFTRHRAGYSNHGNPGQLNVVRSMRSAHARRIALTASKRRRLKALEKELQQERENADILYNPKRVSELEEEISRVRDRKSTRLNSSHVA